MLLRPNVWVVLGIITGAPLCLCVISPPEDSFNILMLLPVATKSHRNLFLPLAKSLADRGHKVTILSNLSPVTKHTRIHEIQHFAYPENQVSPFELRGRELFSFSRFAEILSDVARIFYDEPEVEGLYSRRKEFDVIIISQLMCEVAYPFLYEMPFIAIVPPGMDASLSAVLGNVLNPAYVPSVLRSFPQPLSFINRCLNIIFNSVLGAMWPYVVWKIQQEITPRFPDTPPIDHLHRNVSLAFLNSNVGMDYVMPLLPSQIEIGGIHCRPGQPLPKDLSTWIEGAGDAGVVYFSLGSLAKGTTMPRQYRDLFVAAFARLPQRIIWKFEDEVPGGVSDNVLLSKWLPQQDILAHDSVKVFITHGGLLSTQEAVFHATPLLAVPIFGDQPRNGDRIQQKGWGITLVWEELSVDLIVDSIRALIQQPKYAREVAAASSAMRDQKESPLDRATWWTEYVVRHKGAHALKSPAADLSWIEYLLLDVLYLFLLALFVFIWILCKLKTMVYTLCSKKFKCKED